MAERTDGADAPPEWTGKSHIAAGDVENLPQSLFTTVVFGVWDALAGAYTKREQRSPAEAASIPDMTGKFVDRRSVLGQAAMGTFALAAAKFALAATAANAEGEASPAQPTPFNATNVKAEAKRLADQPFSKPTLELAAAFQQAHLRSVSGYSVSPRESDLEGRAPRLSKFNRSRWAGFTIFRSISGSSTNGSATRLVADSKLFSFGPLIGPAPKRRPYGFSGFRIHGPINRSDYFDEYAVFQGASYLRAVGRGEGYGASARGLALNMARPGGEEFPFFRTFWIEKPKPGATEITVHALLDSQSTTGAYRFTIEPGQTTEMDVVATLYPRTPLTHVGIGSLDEHVSCTGMPASGRRRTFVPQSTTAKDWRCVNGSDERLWRPLNNPKTLQISAFMDKDPKGFGLWQRDRSFHIYEDLEAHYERRPSVWVEPKGQWGDGFIELVEIPVEDEIHDNIVAYWNPAKELSPGGATRFQLPPLMG